MTSISTPTPSRLIIGNWKMHGTLASNQQLLDEIKQGLNSQHEQAQLVVCAPYPYLAQLQHSLTGSTVSWGAQNLNAHDTGAYTGEVSAAMLSDFACSWVLVGHSERRALYAESNDCVLAKVQAALAANITPVVCVGETSDQHAAGQTEAVITQQLQQLLELPTDQLTRIVVAYEPVWAIGTGKSATPEQAEAVHAHIKTLLAARQANSVRVLYGGSVNATNASQLFAMPSIDGALVGGASLKAADFLSIAAS